MPYYTTLAGAVAAAQGIEAYQGGDLEVRPLQDYFDGARLKDAARDGRAEACKSDEYDRPRGRVDDRLACSRFASLEKKVTMDKVPMTAAGFAALEAELKRAPAGRAPAHHRGDLRSALAWRPVGERRISRRQGSAVPQ